jgi:hypothetical protein
LKGKDKAMLGLQDYKGWFLQRGTEWVVTTRDEHNLPNNDFVFKGTFEECVAWVDSQQQQNEEGNHNSLG